MFVNQESNNTEFHNCVTKNSIIRSISTISIVNCTYSQPTPAQNQSEKVIDILSIFATTVSIIYGSYLHMELTAVPFAPKILMAKY